MGCRILKFICKLCIIENVLEKIVSKFDDFMLNYLFFCIHLMLMDILLLMDNNNETKNSFRN